MDKQKEILELLRKYIQSGNINFLIGAGASNPAIPTLEIKNNANIEEELEKLLKEKNYNEYYKELYKFLSNIQNKNNILLTQTKDALKNKVKEVINNLEYEKKLQEIQNLKTTYRSYVNFLKNLQLFLVRRSNNILAKRINIFTTNYDLFLEKASEGVFHLNFNDGFSRVCGLTSQFEFSTHNFFKTTSDSGKFYNYKTEIPTINFIKLHGSLSWKKIRSVSNEKIVFTNEIREDIINKEDIEIIKEYNEKFSLIVPNKDKFRETLLNQIYYDLLRIYSNELDKENTVLFAFGFSFADEHIRQITKRALKNSTLQLIIFSYGNNIEKYKSFNKYQNVRIIKPSDLVGVEKIDFNSLNKILKEILEPQSQNMKSQSKEKENGK